MSKNHPVNYPSDAFMEIVEMVCIGAPLDSYECRLADIDVIDEIALEICNYAAQYFTIISYKFYSLASFICSHRKSDEAIHYLDLAKCSIPKDQKDFYSITAELEWKKYLIYKKTNRLELALNALNNTLLPGTEIKGAFKLKAELLYDLKKYNEALIFTEIAISLIDLENDSEGSENLADLYVLQKQLVTLSLKEVEKMDEKIPERKQKIPKELYNFFQKVEYSWSRDKSYDNKYEKSLKTCQHCGFKPSWRDILFKKWAPTSSDPF